MLEPRRLWTWIWAAGGVLCAALITRYYVGYYSDDALYIVGAKSLLQGRYVSLHLPLQPPMNDPLPGFPLFLAPWVTLVQPHWTALRWVSWFLTLLSGICVWRLGWAWIGEAEALLLLLAFLINPTTVGFSGVVMSEPCFLFFVLFSFVVLERWLRRPPPSITYWIGLGVWMGWAALMRPQGILLPISIVLGLVSIHRRREAAASGLPALALWGSVLARNYLLTLTATGYLSHWGHILPFLGGNRSILAQQLKDVASSIALETLFPFPWAATGAGLWLRYGVLAGIWTLLFLGAWRWARRTDLSRAVRIVLLVFTVSYITVQLSWLAVNLRYFLPILPFLLLFFIEGLETIREKKVFQAVWATLVILWLGSYAYQDAYALKQNQEKSFETQLPAETFSWLKTEVSADQTLLTTGAAEVYLYTGRSAVPFVPGQTRQAFHQELVRQHVGYLVFRPRRLFYVRSAQGPTPDALWSRWYHWATTDPAHFQLAFRSSEDRTQIWRVLP